MFRLFCSLSYCPMMLAAAGIVLLSVAPMPALAVNPEWQSSAPGYQLVRSLREPAGSVRVDALPFNSVRINAVRIDEAQAIRIALHQVAGKVLSVQLVETVYRIKILTSDGRVRTVLVDANSARVLN